MSEAALLSGRAFFFDVDFTGVAGSGGIADVHYAALDLDVQLNATALIANASEVSFQVSIDTEVTGGTPYTVHPRYRRFNVPAPLTILKNPTIVTPGTDLFPGGRPLYGIVGSGNNPVIQGPLSTGKYYIPAGKNFLLRIINNGSQPADMRVSSDLVVREKDINRPTKF